MAIDTLLPHDSSDPTSTTLNEVTTPSTSPTNTLIIASLPPPFFHPRIQAALRTHFEAFGEIHTWAPLTGFGRIMVVYWEDDAVEGAKGLDGVVIGPRVDSTRAEQLSVDGALHNETSYTLRVFRALPTPLSILNSLSSPTTRDPSYYLAPPPLEKNFLISPPGSPPIGWEQIAEDPPNATPLAEDLLAALERLELNRGLGGAAGAGGEDGRAELVRAEEVDGGVGVWVEDVEKINGVGEEEVHDEEEGDWYNPSLVSIPGTVPRTPRPPMTIPHTAMPPSK